MMLRNREVRVSHSHHHLTAAAAGESCVIAESARCHDLVFTVLTGPHCLDIRWRNYLTQTWKLVKHEPSNTMF